MDTFDREASLGSSRGSTRGFTAVRSSKAAMPPVQKNSAFVFIKPHAVTDKVKQLVQETLTAKGITIVRDGRIEGTVIDKDMLIDKHYYAIASKATLMTPDKLPVPTDKFKKAFELDWEDALKTGKVVNAMDACSALGVDADGLGAMWGAAKKADKLVKFGGGFYCGQIDSKDKGTFWVFNGFFMQMRNKFVAPGAAIHYFVVEFDPLSLAWADFRGQVLGPTDPKDAPAGSLRGQLFANWQALGLSSEPNTGDNGIHASASPFEGLCERVNWLGGSFEEDPFGKILIKAGVRLEQLKEWSLDPQVPLGPDDDAVSGSLWDALEDTDVDRCITKCQLFAGVGQFKVSKNIAFVFIKPHALTEKVKILVQNSLREKGLSIVKESQINGTAIDEYMLIDKHYYSIASKATLLKPDQLNVPKDKFRDKFKVEWDEVLKSGKALNAKDACDKLGVDGDKLGELWLGAKKSDTLLKLGGGFYVALINDFYIFNGFFMSMRGKFVAPGSAIHYYVVEWDPLDLSWTDFRGTVLGPTDPAKAPVDSIRGIIYSNWKDLGLGAEPNQGDNGVHASASPFEGLAERMNWLGYNVESDAFGQRLIAAGVSKQQIEEWSTDPQVNYNEDGDGGSLFDALEDTDAERCTLICQKLAGVGRFVKSIKNRAFVFIKPHAMNDKVKQLVRNGLQQHGLKIVKELQIDGTVIDKYMLIDKHYYSIASKATLLTPDQLNVPQDQFRSKFGLEWEDALKTGFVVNAKDACEKIGVDADELGNMWLEAKKQDKLIKFGGGFYCGQIDTPKGNFYVFNGFFMSMRNKFVAPGAAIYYYVVDWDPLDISWSDFRAKILGPTDPAKAPTDSLRGMLFANWKKYGLATEPNTGDNGVHASASPFEALAERMNWLGYTADNDMYGRLLLNAGISMEQIEEWAKDPQVAYGSGEMAQSGSLFDCLEDMDADRCITKCQQLGGVGEFTSVVKNRAIVFIKPHAVTDKVKALVQETLAAKGLNIVKEAQIDGTVIDSLKLIDRHYYSIASKATLQKPHELNVPKDKFKEKFSADWDEELAKGNVYNAMDACEKLGLDATGLGAKWKESQKADMLVKFGGGFYCGKLGDIYVMNGFFMEMRNKFCAPGASIYYYYVEWDLLKLSWSDFRGKVLGPTDPAKAPEDSLRGILFKQWADYGLAFEPNTGDNGIHASASPFEGLAERMNWLGYTADNDAYGKFLIRAGMTKQQIDEWSVDPQITYGPDEKTGSVFDALEDLDADRCITMCQMMADVGRFSVSIKNRALLFIKPHALNEKVRQLVVDTLSAKRIQVVKDAQIDGSVIDELKLIDKHYYAIASKATLLKPDALNVPKEKFQEFFGLEWETALQSGNVVNASDACEKLGVDADGLGKLWLDAKKDNLLIKFGGGFYCGKVKDLYVFNGFFMQMRNKFVAPGAAIYYYYVEWDPLDLSWSDFRGQVLGATDPSKAPTDSLRGTLYTQWKEYGLSSQPDTGDNGVHASASPFEGLVERMNWLGYTAEGDAYGRLLTKAGIKVPTIEEWKFDPQVQIGDKTGSVYDALEDMDADRCVTMCQSIASTVGTGRFSKKSKNCAFVFVKPHAMTDKVKGLVQETLKAKGFAIKQEGQIDGSTIDKDMLIDKHYYSIASKATLLTPDKLNIPVKEFKREFEVDWEDALKSGKAVNAKEACERLGVGADALGELWNKAKEAKALVKFGGGFYCAKIEDLFVFNGFFMSMRNKFVAAGAAIYYFVVEWDPLDLSWEDFRGKVLGPTDPSTAPDDSLRGMLYAKWEEFGLKSKPNTGDNGVHASASPFEGLAERMNWLGQNASTDEFAQMLMKAGVSKQQIEDWSNDPQVTYGDPATSGSLFDALEDLDADRCVTKCAMIAGVFSLSGKFTKVLKNRAFVFIKPHALTEKVRTLVQNKLQEKGLTIITELQIDGSVIDKYMLIDKHYYAIASKATLLTPDQLNVPKDKFKEKFGLQWDDAVKNGSALNAKDACEKLGVDAEGLGTIWNQAKDTGDIVKFGGGFYCAKLSAGGKGPFYVFNGFFMSMRNKFVAPGAAIYYYVVEWDPLDLSWADFRGNVLGPTDPAKAPEDSLRGLLYKNWKEFGLSSEPNTGDNGIHASASPFEALAERMNWLGSNLEKDNYGRMLVNAGVSPTDIEEWTKDPQVTYPDGESGSLWDYLEDSDADRCITMCQSIGGVGKNVKSVKNRAFVFIKPHAMGDKVKALVQKTLVEKGISIAIESQIDGSVIDQDMLIDKHYYSIASKATLLKPDKLNVPKDKFKGKFGVDWYDALNTGNVLNALDTCERLGIDAGSLANMWSDAQKKDKLIKFGGGFYCAEFNTDKGTIYCFNGFFMSMRNKFVAPGAAIYYYVVEWDPLDLSWEDFRGQVLGPTDPTKAPADSLRGMIYANWKDLGLPAEPNNSDNGVHGSASPFEGLAERMNWLGYAADNDIFGRLLIKAGVQKEVIEEWSKDPQVSVGDGPQATVGSLFDNLEDLDADRCITTCQRLAGIGRFSSIIKNRAFVFIKPHALTDDVIPLVQDALRSKGVNIVIEAQIDGKVIDELKLIDKHYYAIASKATLLTPDQLNVPENKFKAKFGLDWKDVLASGKAVNAIDACSKLGVPASKLGDMWNEAKDADQLVKLGGGFYCGKIGEYYVFNGFFMAMREKFVAPGAAIYYFYVEWDPDELSWADFRGSVLGPTDPAKAPEDSLRGILYRNWEKLGLKSQPNTGDNGVHASASPFEGLAERMNWLGYTADNDTYGKQLLRMGVTKKQIDEWSKDPQVAYFSQVGSVYDILEDTDADRCAIMCQAIAGVGRFARSLKSIALVFIKPHALTEQVKTFVKDQLKDKGLVVKREAQLDGNVIDEMKLIDNHYYAIASKATLLTPDQLNVPADKFQDKFGIVWADALASGNVVNGKDACTRLAVDADGLGKLWNESKDAGQLVKFGGGFYCAKIQDLYVFNGFFMSMRNKFVAPGSAIYYFVVEWDPLDLSWEDFRGQVLGPTDPSKAPTESLRGALYSRWQDFGLSSQPNTGDNGIHGSASPFEGLCERMNWLGHGCETDPYGRALLRAGLTVDLINEWSKDPQVKYGPSADAKSGSLWDALEDTDADRCTIKCQMIAGVVGVGRWSGWESQAAKQMVGGQSIAVPKLAHVTSGEMCKILHVRAREIYDSRGNPTVEVDLISENGMFRAAVPSGASTGAYEALELRDGDKDRLMGKGVEKAVENINKIIGPKIVGMDVTQQAVIDKLMVESLDGSYNEWGWSKAKLGANAILAVSMAVCRAGADANYNCLYHYIARLAGKPVEKFIIPVPAFNVINGGTHAGNRLACQEFMILPVGASTFCEAMIIGSEVYHTLKGVIKKKYGQDACNVGDEGGFAPNVQDSSEALGVLMEAIDKSGHKEKVKIATDVAASEFYDKGTKMYDLDFKNPSSGPEMKKSSAQLADMYKEWFQKYPFASIEDPFDQDDWEAYSKFNESCGKEQQIVGDDLLVTNPVRIQKALQENACNALLLKVNQIGSVTEAIEAAMLAQSQGWGVMVSHRSGETEDTFISDLVVGLNAGEIKSGAPCRSERLAKYNELLRIEEELGDLAVYAGTTFRKPL